MIRIETAPPKRARTDSFNDAMATMIQLKIKKMEKSAVEEVIVGDSERKVKEQMVEYVQKNKNVITQCIDKNEFDYETITSAIQRISIKIIIGCYCLPGQRFNAMQFRNDMMSMGLDMLTAMQLWEILEEIRVKMRTEELSTPSR